MVRLRSRLVQEALAVAGIAIGVALVFAALVANTSLTGSMEQLTAGIVGDASLQLVARGPRGFDERLLSDVERLDGVEAVAPMVEARANVVGPQGRRSVLLVGGDPRFARIGGPLARPFGASAPGSARYLSKAQLIAVPAPIASSLGISVGAPIRIETDVRSIDVPLGIQLQESDIGVLVESPVTLAPLAYAQRISGLDDRLTRVFVKPRPGREADVEHELRQLAAGKINVRAADADIAVFEQAAYPTKQSTTLFSVLSALVGFLFAFSAVLLTVAQRRGFVADLQMAGHDMRTVVTALLFDALMLGVAGSLVGLALGDMVSRHLFDEVPDYLSFTFSIGVRRTVAWHSVAIAVGAGLLAALLAVFVPLRDAVATHPLMARPPAHLSHATARLTVAGLGFLLLATLVVVTAPDLAIVGLVALTIALLLLLAPLLRLATDVLARVTQATNGSSALLAVLELRSRASQPRTLAVAATGALALFATVSIAGARADLQRGLDASTRDNVGNADVWVTFPDAPNVLATTPFPDSRRQIAALERLPGISAVHVYRGSLLDVGDRRAWVLAPPRAAAQLAPPSQIREGDARLATARLRGSGWIVLSETIAAAEHVGVGDRVTLPSPVPTTFRVAAVSTNLGWSPGAIVLNADDYARAWGTTEASALQIDLDPGVSPGDVKDEIEQALGSAVPLQAETVTERIARHYAASRDGLTRLSQISALVLVAAILAMTISMGGMIWQRRPTLARLKVQGFSERELWRALLLESGLFLGTGCLVGAVFGLYGQILLSRALEIITGFPVFYSMAGVLAITVLAVVTVIALAMLALPGWLAVRVRATPGASA
ncbi:MAG TPA: ABC transporter permease [Thermoleophilaceae bacterium]|nr:ABC transporter permease [Thermoleophilaceae bacterium]